MQVENTHHGRSTRQRAVGHVGTLTTQANGGRGELASCMWGLPKVGTHPPPRLLGCPKGSALNALICRAPPASPLTAWGFLCCSKMGGAARPGILQGQDSRTGSWRLIKWLFVLPSKWEAGIWTLKSVQEKSAT